MQRCCFQAHRKLYLALASSPGYITTFSYLRVPSHNFLKLQSGSLYQRRGKCCVLDFRGPVVYCVASRLSAIRHLDVSEYPAGYFRRPSDSGHQVSWSLHSKSLPILYLPTSPCLLANCLRSGSRSSVA